MSVDPASIGDLEVEIVRQVEDAIPRLLLPGERVLAVARLDGSTPEWSLFLGMAEHRFARVGLLDGADPAIVEVLYADVVSSSWLSVEFWTAGGGRVILGRLADELDAERLADAMQALSIPTTARVRCAE